jgi:PncC family amidohydrolase
MEQVNLHELVELLGAQNLTVGFAESCTGGRLSADLTTVPGSSSVVMGSLVCYQLEAKRRILGIQVSEDNVVSDQTAKAMVDAARRKFETDITVATTGYIDPSQPGGAHAYWAIIRPVIGDTVGHMHWDWKQVRFPHYNTREANRESLLQEIFRELLTLARKFSKASSDPLRETR